MKSELYIVRHTETIGNIEKRLTGRQDYELTENGVKSILKLTKKLENIRFDAIYSSTSGRAIKTVEPLAKLNNLPIQQLENLCEMYFGIYDGWKWEDVNKIQPEIKENQNRVNEIYGIEKQETMKEVANRMYDCIKNIAQQNIGKKVLISSHGVAIEAFLRKITNIPFSIKRKEFCQHNTALNKVDYENGYFTINILANLEHLEQGEENER